MAERYTRLFSLPENLYTPGAPVVIAAGALLKDNQTEKTLAQIKFKSISEKQIKAVKISVSAFDVSDKELDGVAEYQYLDLSAIRTAEFGQKQAVTLPDEVTRSFVAKCTDVIFTDGTVWSAAPDAIWTTLPAQKSVTAQLGNLAAQYQRDTSYKSKYIPMEYEDLWLCSCGAINHCEETKCHNCRHSKTALFAALSIDALRQREAEYTAAETEKAEKKAAADKVQRAKSTKVAIIAALVIAIVATAFWLTTKIVIPNGNYNDAVALMETGNYEEAISVFEALEGYKDSVDKILECKYDFAIDLMDAGHYEEAIAIFKAFEGYEDSADKISICEIAILDRKYNDAVALMEAEMYEQAISNFEVLENYKDSKNKIEQCYSGILGAGVWEFVKNCAVGDTFFFGAYEQDNNNSNGKEPIEWKVLAKEDTRILVISTDALDSQPYDTTKKDITWENCTLRKWLNNDFVKSAFSDAELNAIPVTTVHPDSNTEYHTDQGYSTQDKVFLLSAQEANLYFSSNNDRMCKATPFASAQGAWAKDDFGGTTGYSRWRLRTSGKSNNLAVVVIGGGIGWGGDYVSMSYYAIRPAMWIGIEY